MNTAKNRSGASHMSPGFHDSPQKRFRRSGTYPSRQPTQDQQSVLEPVFAFLDYPIADWNILNLVCWFSDYLVSPGLMRMPQVIREPGTTPARLDPRVESDAVLQALIARAHERVTLALRGLLLMPIGDDRFMNAAIYGGRVRRGIIEGKPRWVASPKEIDFLSDIVLSLVAADVLMDPEFFRTHLNVCDLCGKIYLQRDKQERSERSLCYQHEHVYADRAALRMGAPPANDVLSEQLRRRILENEE